MKHKLVRSPTTPFRPH